jgi:hypothetical protein
VQSRLLGAIEQFSGRLTVCPLLFTYVPLFVQFDLLGSGLALVVAVESALEGEVD